MDAPVESKWQEYHGRKDFERGRAKMWAKGWVIAEERTRPGKWPYISISSGSSLEMLFWPILWLFNRTQPKEILAVRYERAAKGRFR